MVGLRRPEGKVQAAFSNYSCRDACVSRAIIETTGRAPNGRGDQGECDYRQYANGRWSSYDQLKSAVQAKFSPAARPSAPATPAPAAPARIQVPDSYVLGSALGNKQCLGVENGRAAAGARLILWPCNGQDDQSFTFTSDGQIHAFNGSNMCVTAYGGQGKAGDPIQIHPCQRGWANQAWRYDNGLIRGMNNRCIDIRGGVYAGNKDAILWDCSGAVNQKFAWGKIMPATVTGLMGSARPVTLTDASGHAITLNSNGVITMGGGNVIAMGGGNMIPINGGKVITFGGGNVIAFGGGN